MLDIVYLTKQDDSLSHVERDRPVRSPEREAIEAILYEELNLMGYGDLEFLRCEVPGIAGHILEKLSEVGQ